MKVNVVLGKPLQDVCVQIHATLIRHSAMWINDQDLRIYVSALQQLSNPIDPIRQAFKHLPVRHLEEKRWRRVVLAQAMRAIEEPVRHEAIYPRDQQRFCNHLGVLKSRSPAETVIALAQRVLFFVEVSG